jgi:hypothetical protein
LPVASPNPKPESGARGAGQAGSGRGGVRLRVGHEKKMSLFFGREEEKEDRKEWEEVRVSDTGSRRAKVSVLLFADDGLFGSLGWTKGRGIKATRLTAEAFRPWTADGKLFGRVRVWRACVGFPSVCPFFW